MLGRLISYLNGRSREAGFRLISYWQKPKIGWVKMNVDGSIIQRQGVDYSGIGAVIRDHQGNDLLKAWKGSYIDEITALELFAIQEGMVLARRLGYKRVIFETDCENAKSMIYSPKHYGPKYGAKGPLVGNIRNLMRAHDWEVKVEHQKNKANETAHLLAQMGTRNWPPTEFFWPANDMSIEDPELVAVIDQIKKDAGLTSSDHLGDKK